MEERNYKVYIHRNKINGKAYVGQTKQKPEKRWLCNGSGYKSQKYFWRAIGKYGWDGFDHSVCAENLTSEEADEIEICLIRMLGTTNRDYGYNIKTGGKGGIDETALISVDQYSLEGKLLTTYKSIADASEATNTRANSISECCSGKIQTSNGFVWRYHGESFSEVFYRRGENARRVCQYTLDGELISVFESIKKAAISTGSRASTINMCCNGGRCKHNGFVWRYAEDEFDKYDTKGRKEAPVDVYDLKGNYLASFESIKTAAKMLGVTTSHISDVCLGHGKNAHGLVWRHVGEPFDKHDTKNRNGEIQSKAVVQFDKHGNFMRFFRSVTEAAETVKGAKTNISACCRHKVPKAYGYIWRYVEEVGDMG